MTRIESLLAARLFLAPQSLGGRIYFLSNMGGHLSLYAMDDGGSVPEPLLPPHIALQIPALMTGYAFYVFPGLGRILVMLDADGDENYQPMMIPLEGGFPEPAFGDQLAKCRVHLLKCDPERNVVYLGAESREEPIQIAYRGRLESAALEELARSRHRCDVAAVNAGHTKAAIVGGYATGDNVLHLWTEQGGAKQLLYGKPLEERQDGEVVPLNAIEHVHFTSGEKGLLLTTALFADTYGLGYVDLGRPGTIVPVEVTGTVHQGSGELKGLDHIDVERYIVEYNIDGCSWLYEGSFDETARRMVLDKVLVGRRPLADGMLESVTYDKQADRFALSLSTATSPTQLYSIEGKERTAIRAHTRERVIGIPSELLAPGEDASFTSFDGQRVSARLYLPVAQLGFKGPRPLVYYVHGGPQSQERPNFAWFSIPLIQFLTLRGFAVFVPNARGSTGYGLTYTKKVDRDWGGDDRLDHVHAMKVLGRDTRVDTGRAAVVGRSYGGYMTLTLAARHPELWAAAVDMFGPYDLLTFMERIPETWKPYFEIVLGNVVTDREFLVERSPKTHIEKLRCPLLVIQGRNDPRVVERESRDVVERLRAMGKTVEYLVFENEGHDVLKFENRVRCYNGIADFFITHLKP